jgi:hypothetical protein
MITSMPSQDQESERRAPRPATRTLPEILDAFTRDAADHMTGEPSSERDLLQLERAVGRPLPASLRAFLSRFGGGLFYHGHEIFGPLRVMIHDIELVPDMLSVRRRLAREGVVPPEGLIPFHRARGLVHFMDLRQPGDAVLSLPWSTPYPDLGSFLENVVLPRPPQS